MQLIVHRWYGELWPINLDNTEKQKVVNEVKQQISLEILKEWHTWFFGSI